MSTISQTPRIKTSRLFDNRIQFVLLAVAVIAMLAVIFINLPHSQVAVSVEANAYRLYRQGEWTSVPFTPAQAYQIFRRGEVAPPVSHAEAYRIYRQGEWASASTPVTAGDLSAYHISERTLVDSQAGLAIYHNSEWTSIPVQFTPYQRSEWFGE
jgi:hypothetical protein